MSRTIEVLTSFVDPMRGVCRAGVQVRLPDALADAAVARGDARYADGQSLDRSSPLAVTIRPEPADDGAELRGDLDAMAYHGDDGILSLAKDLAEFLEEELPGRTREELTEFCLMHPEATRLILEDR